MHETSFRFPSSLAPRPTPLAPPRGFTLVEIVLVAATLAILLVVALPNFLRAGQRLHAEQAAVTLTHLLRYAHERAIMQSEPIVWVWEDERRRAHLEHTDGRPLPEPVAQSRPLDEDIEVSGTRQRIPFRPDGTSEATTLLVTHHGHVYTVTVDGTTSQIVLTMGPTS